MFDFKTTFDKPQLISARALLKAIGILAFVLPIFLVITAAVLDNCELFQNSISAYYHTSARNLFVGALCAIAFCLFAYRGYGGLDNFLANIAALLMLGVAFFPTSLSGPTTYCLDALKDMGRIGDFHFIFAALLFVLLGIFSAFIFTKTGGNITGAKIRRNKVYRTCGYLIFFFIILIAVYIKIIKDFIPGAQYWKAVYWLETFSLWAFAFSWLVKGGIFLKDAQA